MKKLFAVLLTLSLLLCLAACGGKGAEITVISREEASGTRSAFVELTGVEEDGVDRTYARAEINSSTAVVMQTVAGNENAIGYISLGSLSDTVKALSLDGAEATAENVRNGSYPLARPFILGTLGEQSPLVADFYSYILSEAGQTVISEAGYVSTGSQGSYESSHLNGTIKVMGSTSVAPVMEKLAEAYMAVNPDVTVQVQTSDSSQGLSSLAEGLCDVAMSSRNLKDSEIEKGIEPVTICMDGIAVIVNNNNSLSNLTMTQLKEIFLGNVTAWDEVQ